MLMYQLGVAAMSKKNDNSIHIGNGNKIKSSTIGNYSNNSKCKEDSEKWYQKLMWQIIIPIIVTVVGGAIIFFLHMN